MGLREHLTRFLTIDSTAGFLPQFVSPSCYTSNPKANCSQPFIRSKSFFPRPLLATVAQRGIANFSNPMSPVLQSFAGGLSQWSQRTMFSIAAITVTPLPRPTVQSTPNPSQNTRSSPRYCSSSVHYPALSVRKRGYQVWLNDQMIALMSRRSHAQGFANRLRAVLQDPEFEPALLRPAIARGLPVGLAGEAVLFEVDRSTEALLHRSGDLLAIDWINTLRTALGTEPIPLVEAQMEMYGLARSHKTLGGIASWYGPYFHNRPTATGERFNQNELTAAHPSLPFNTYLKVTNLKNQASVIVRINDRGPYIEGRSLDLSRLAARCIQGEEDGLMSYRAIILRAAGGTGKLLAKAGDRDKRLQLAQVDQSAP